MTELPPALQQIAVRVDRVDPALVAAVQKQLIASGAQIIASADAAARLELAEGGIERRLLSLTSGGKAREYLLVLSIRFGLIAAEEAPAANRHRQPSQRITLERTYRFDEANVLGSGDAEAQLRREMVVEAAQRIVRRLQMQEVAQ